MTDFFGQLETQLTDAARRRARRRRPSLPHVEARIVLAVAAAAAVFVAVFGVLSAVDGTRDPEVAAPGPGPVLDCDSDSPPDAILGRYAVLRRERDADDELPEAAQAAVTGDEVSTVDPDGSLARVWTDSARLVSGGDYGRVYLVPALDGTCEAPVPVVCAVHLQDGAVLPNCYDLARIADGGAVAEGRRADGFAFTVFLIPDGVAVRVDGATSTSGGRNVIMADHEPGAQVGLEDDGDYGFFESCLKRLEMEDSPAPAAVERMLGVFRSPATDTLPGDRWLDAVDRRGIGTLHRASERIVHRFAGTAVSVVAFSDGDVDCETPADEPEDAETGACIVVAPPRGEYGGDCFSLREIVAGEAVRLDWDARDRMRVVALVPDGVTGATLNGQRLRLDGNLATLEDATPRRGRPILALEAAEPPSGG